jgi:NDP-sugar pyrophosphorylase family protein
MKAMVLAAGLGTRLRPLTNDRPKALVEIAGRTLLEITLTRLRSFGVSEAIVNVHHFADLVVDYLKARQNFGMRIEISRENVLLDTGGGLKKASWFFAEGRHSGNQPFLLHNVDVLSTIDLSQMMQAHRNSGRLATLAVQQRDSSRQLLFDDAGQLCGRRASRDRDPEIVRSSQKLMPLAFSGIHIISPQLLTMFTEDGVFSIIEVYLRLAAEGQAISAFRADQFYWRDLGKPENITQAALDVAADPRLQ